MKNKDKELALLRLVLLLFGVFVAALSFSEAFAGADKGADSGFQRCKVASLNNLVRREVLCRGFSVPENYDELGGKKIKLVVFKLTARARNKELDPVLMLAGGPGQAASRAYLNADQNFRDLNQYRDIYLIDQRGTGASTAFDCPAIANLGPEDLEQSLDVEPLVKSCLADFGHDASQFTTAVSIRDFEHVRTALGLRQWNLVGTSYGTRVAFEYARAFPRSIRSMVLDSVVPPNVVLGAEISQRSQFALDALFERCERDPACRKTFPNLKLVAMSLFESLKAEPVKVVYEDVTQGRMRELNFSDQHLALVVRLALYQDETMATLPLLLQQASQGRFSVLAKFYKQYEVQLEDSIHIGLHNSVACSEDISRFDQGGMQDLGDKAASSKSYLGDKQISFLKSICEYWPKGQALPEVQEPAVSVPTLMLSGELDPVTPPLYAEKLGAYLTDATHIILPGQGHSVSTVSCMPRLIARFVATAKTETLPVSCAETLKPFPFFTSVNGPSIEAIE